MPSIMKFALRIKALAKRCQPQPWAVAEPPRVRKHRRRVMTVEQHESLWSNSAPQIQKQVSLFPNVGEDDVIVLLQLRTPVIPCSFQARQILQQSVERKPATSKFHAQSLGDRRIHAVTPRHIHTGTSEDCPESVKQRFSHVTGLIGMQKEYPGHRCPTLVDRMKARCSGVTSRSNAWVLTGLTQARGSETLRAEAGF